jgi:hypothetical protein
VPNELIEKIDSLDGICAVANRWLDHLDNITDPGDRNKVAKTVRINLFVHSLKQHGNVKPILIHYKGQYPMTPANGGTRFLAAERLPEFNTWPCFISTAVKYKQKFQHLKEIKSMAAFAEACKADANTKFLLRLTDSAADHGLDWYEVDLPTTFVPNDDLCIQWLQQYQQSQHSNFQFTKQWFDQAIDWTTLGHQAAKSNGHC